VSKYSIWSISNQITTCGANATQLGLHERKTRLPGFHKLLISQKLKPIHTKELGSFRTEGHDARGVLCVTPPLSKAWNYAARLLVGNWSAT